MKLRDALLVGLCFTGEFFFVSEGLRFTSAAHMSVLLYTAPLFSAVGLAVKLPEERLNVIQWTGLLLAFCGILVAFLLPALTERRPKKTFGSSATRWAWAPGFLGLRRSSFGPPP